MEIIQAQKKPLILLTGIDPEEMTIVIEPLEFSEDRITLVVPPVEISLPLAGLVDVAAERERLEKELAEVQSQINRLEKLLTSPFANKAPAEVVDKEREKLITFQETAEKIRKQLG